MRSTLRFLLIVALHLGAAQSMWASPIVVSGCSDIELRVAEFRALLGSRNSGWPSPDGRREIDWEGADRYWLLYPVDGLFVEGPGEKIRISNGRFADVNPSYANQFGAFSGRASVAMIGETSLRLGFLRGTDFGEDPTASVSGFGVIFSDVDIRGSASIEAIGADRSLGAFAAPPRCTESGLSFIGVVFTNGGRIQSVRITAGDRPIGATIDDISDGGEADLVVMDDFIYSEPLADDKIFSASLAPWQDNDGGFSEKIGARGLVVLGAIEAYSWLSYTARVENVSGRPYAIHLHQADGTLLVTLADHPSHFSHGGLPVDAGLLRQIIADPSRFFIDVHTGGGGTSLRGQPERGVTAPTKIALPIVGHTSGWNGSQYRTDLTIANLSAEPADVLLEFIPQEAGHVSPLTSRIVLAPNEQRVMEDVVDAFGLFARTGGMQLFSSAPLDVSARVYNDRSLGNQGTYGEWERGITDEEALTAGVLPMLSAGEGPYRTNIGWFNPSPKTIDVRFEARDAAGATYATATVEISSYEQLQMRSGQLFPGLDLQNFYVRFHATHALFVYASVVHQTSGDSTLIPAQEVSEGQTRLIFPRVPGDGGTHHESTDVAIVNPGNVTALATLIFRANGSTELRSVEIAAGEQRLFGQIVRSEFGLANAIGGMELLSVSPLIAAAHVSSRGGAIGHFEAPINTQRTNRTRGVLPGLSSDHPDLEQITFKPTIGWFNAGSAAVNLTFRSKLGVVTRVAAPFEQFELPVDELFTNSWPTNYFVMVEADVDTVIVYATVRDLISSDTILIGPVVPILNLRTLDLSGQWRGTVTYNTDPVIPEETCEPQEIAPIFVQSGNQLTATFTALCLGTATIKVTVSGTRLQGTITAHGNYAGTLEGTVTADSMHLKSSNLSSGSSFYIGHSLNLYR